MTVVTEELWAAFEKSRVPQLLILAVSAKMLASFSLTSFLPIWFARTGLHGYTNDAYAFWNALAVSLAGLLSVSLGSVLGQTWSRVDVCAPCYVGMLGALISLPLLAIMLLTQWFRTALLCYFTMLVVGEAWFGPTMTLLQKAVRKSVAGQATSMMLGIATLAGNLGPAIIGILDPGGVNIGVHLLWICSTAQVLAALSFYWTYREITVDPVSVTLGLSQDVGVRAACLSWTIRRLDPNSQHIPVWETCLKVQPDSLIYLGFM
ncbi:spin [Symbiodinium pilosum]|uniref:Spin protein n=1 Tax=Symbiodinium pilosum TaxID=2952 RepID=A0A812J273_SYMPI|nr:spin [Symbiodinium pilosum]